MLLVELSGHCHEFGGTDLARASEGYIRSEEVFRANGQAFADEVVDDRCNLLGLDFDGTVDDEVLREKTITLNFDAFEDSLFESGDGDHGFSPWWVSRLDGFIIVKTGF